MKFIFGRRPVFQFAKNEKGHNIQARINFNSVEYQGKTFSIHQTLFVDFSNINTKVPVFSKIIKNKKSVYFEMQGMKIENYMFGNWSHSTNYLCDSINKKFNTVLSQKEIEREMMKELKNVLFDTGTKKYINPSDTF